MTALFVSLAITGIILIGWGSTVTPEPSTVSFLLVSLGGALLGAVASGAELATVGGVVSSAVELAVVGGVVSSGAELVTVGGVVSSGAELVTVGGVVSSGVGATILTESPVHVGFISPAVLSLSTPLDRLIILLSPSEPITWKCNTARYPEPLTPSKPGTF